MHVAFCVIDLEATCNQNGPPPVPQEIIEFPAFLYEFNQDQGKLQLISSLEQFVQPKFHPKLSDFCTSLTTITQEMVDTQGIPWNKALSNFVLWWQCFADKYDTIIPVCYGRWDFDTAIPNQCRATGTKVPKCLDPSRCIDVKDIFKRVCGENPGGMMSALKKLRIRHTGVHHRGADDCRNIAAILEALLQVDYVRVLPLMFHANQ